MHFRRERSRFEGQTEARGRWRRTRQPVRRAAQQAVEPLEQRLLLSASTPYTGTPYPITSVIQAENFDKGGQNVAYYNPAGNVNKGGVYRSTEGVGIQPTTDTGGGYNIGWLAAGEWINYTVNVAAAGKYELAFRVASSGSGGKFHVDVDGANDTGAITVPNTGAWQTFQTIDTAAFNLTAGQHVLQLDFDSVGTTGWVGNFNWFQGIDTTPPPAAPSGLTVTSVSSNSVSLSWTNVATNASSIMIERSTGGGALATIPAAAALAPTTTTFTDTGLASATQYSYEVIAVNANGQSPASNVVSPTTSAAPSGPAGTDTPYSGTPVVLPAVIQAENFDKGGQGVAYYNPAGNVNDGGAYRPTEGVGIQATTDTGGGYNIGWLTAGEWINYTVSVATPGTYTFTFRVASSGNGGTFHMDEDGVNVTGSLTVPNTGGWQTFQTITAAAVSLSAGQHVLQLDFDSNGATGWLGNINWFAAAALAPAPTVPAAPTGLALGTVASNSVGLSWDPVATNATSIEIERATGGGAFAALPAASSLSATATSFTDTSVAASTPYSYEAIAVNSTGHSTPSNVITTTTPAASVPVSTPYSGTPVALPGTIQAENFDLGGQGVAYYDPLGNVNSGGAYRANEGLGIQATTDTGGGYNIGWTVAGEWINYTVSVATAGSYTFTYRVASSGQGGNFHMDVDGANATGTLTAPNTGGWQTFQTITAPAVTLSAGQHVLQLDFDTVGSTGFTGNMNWFAATAAPSTPPVVVPVSPTLTSAVASSSSAVTLNWVPGDATATSFTVQRALGTTASFATIPGASALPATATSYTDTGLPPSTQYSYRVIANDSAGASPPSNTLSATTLTTGTASAPYGGTPAAIPGTIQAENFDLGGQGVAYYDPLGNVNEGGAYRPSEGVGIEPTADNGGGYDVGWTFPGEWLQYTVDVANTGFYNFSARVATFNNVGATFNVDMDGADVTGIIDEPVTGGTQQFDTVSVPNIYLTAGVHEMRVIMDSGGRNNSVGNFNWFSFTQQQSGSGAQPDVWIRAYGAPFYSGEGVTNSTGVNQTVDQSTSFYPVIYQCDVQNNGFVPDSFTITGPAGDPSADPTYHITYFDSQVQGMNGAADITAQVTGAGWNTGILQPGQSDTFRFEVGPTDYALANATYTTVVTATSVDDPSLVDKVIGVTTVSPAALPELNRLNAGATGPYQITVTNEGNVNDHFVINGTDIGAGAGTYSVQYYDAFSGGQNITAAVEAGGWTTPLLAPKQSQSILVVLTPLDGQVHSVTITATSTTDSTQSDSIDVSNAVPAAGPSFFPIGVWSQPTYSFAGWKSMGVNTLVNYESQGGAVSVAQWTSAAVANGMYMIRQPSPDPADDIGQANLLAWMQPDEPELQQPYNASLVESNYNAWKAIDPSMPIFTNFSGGYVLGWQTGQSASSYETYLPYTDWDSSCLYAISGFNRPQSLDAPARTLGRLSNWSNGSPQFAVIEVSDQLATYLPPGVEPEATQVHAEIWDSVIHGATGIIYFPQSIYPSFNYNNMPADVAAQITQDNATLASISPALVSPADPPSMGLNVSSPLQGCWRSYGGKSYYIVMNTSSIALTAQSIQFTGIDPTATSAVVQGESRSVSLSNGAFTDNFAPYGVHIYVVS